MPRKLLKIKFIFIALLALLTVILIYFLFYQTMNSNTYDQFIVVKEIETEDDDGVPISKLINFTNFQYKIKPDSLCNDFFEDELLGKKLHNLLN